MDEYDEKPVKLKKNINDIPSSLIRIFQIKDDFNKNLYMKKVLKSLKQEESQKMILTERNNSYKKENKEVNMNFDYNEKSNYKEYPKNTNTKTIFNNSMYLIRRLNKNNNNNNNSLSQRHKLNNNSYSTINVNNRTIIHDNPSKLSSYIIKPYKKKTIIMDSNPIKNKKLPKKITIDIKSPETNDNSNSFTDRTFCKNKLINYNRDENLNIINLKYTLKDNKILGNKKYEKKENKYKNNRPLIYLGKDENYNKSINTSRQKPKLLDKIKGKTSILRNALTPDKLMYAQFQRRLAQVLILLLEKYYKTYLLKFKYLFINNLRKYKINKKFKIRKRNKEISFLNNNPKTEIRNEINYDYKYDNNTFLNKFNSRKEKLLMYKLKNGHFNNTPNNSYTTELCRNLSELIKMKNLINRRKKSQNKSLENDNIIKDLKYRKTIYPIHNINKSSNSKKRNKSDMSKNNNNSVYQYKGKTLIIKKIISEDKKIYIDIKYIDYVNFENKKKFKNLKISKDFSIDLIRQASKKNLIIKKLGRNYYNRKNFEKYELNCKNNLDSIKEEEEKTIKKDNYYSQSKKEKRYGYF